MANKKKVLNSKLTAKPSKKSSTTTKKVIKSDLDTEKVVKEKKTKYQKIQDKNKVSAQKKTSTKRFIDDKNTVDKKAYKTKTENKPIYKSSDELNGKKKTTKKVVKKPVVKTTVKKKTEKKTKTQDKKKVTKKVPPKKEEEDKDKLIKKEVTKKELKTLVKTQKKEQKQDKPKLNDKIKNNKYIVKLGSIKLSRFKKIAILCCAVVFIAVLVLFLIKENPADVLGIYKKYSIGEKIQFGGSNWYVIEDSGSNKKAVKMISEKPLDLNKNKKLEKKDMVKFDSEGNYELDSKSDKNIAFALKNKYLLLINDSNKISDISLLTSEQYIKIRTKMGYDYTWSKGNFLASKSIGIYWIGTSNNKHVYAVNTNGSYRLESPTSKYYVRPVITVHKNNL